MSNYSTHPRILFVTPEGAFMPAGGGNHTNFISTNAGGFGEFLAELIGNLFELGVDVHVAQPDFRKIFANRSRKEKAGESIKLPCDRVHLAEDRAIFYSKPINSNSEWENLKISLAFQREVINQIIPRVQPDLIHCYDWMTGLIPAAAKKIEISCLFTVQKFDTARSILAYVEDIGIDAAGFWQNLFYDNYPVSYEQTRDTNSLDLLLSGILAASHVNTTDPLPLPGIAEGQSDFMNSSLGQVLAQKWRAGCACEISGPPHIGPDPTNSKKLVCSYRPKGCHAGNQGNDRAKRQPISSSENWTTAKCYIDLYETILRRPLVTSENKKVWPINKNSGINISGVQVISCREARSAKSYALNNEKISTVVVAPI
ncbi:glycogen/starch synthase [Thermodesulfobacteriota bacterium]